METNEGKVVILGAGGHAGAIIDLIECLYGETASDRIELLDDNISKGSVVHRRRVIGKIAACMEYPPETGFIIGVGNNWIRKQMAEQFPLSYLTLIHPRAVIGKNAEIGPGTVIMANAVINCESRVGSHCIINTASTIDHECRLENYVHISPGVHLGGRVKVGEGSWLGIGSCVKNDISIGANVVVGAGGVVVHNIKEKGIYVGIPAEKKR